MDFIAILPTWYIHGWRHKIWRKLPRKWSKAYGHSRARAPAIMRADSFWMALVLGLLVTQKMTGLHELWQCIKQNVMFKTESNKQILAHLGHLVSGCVFLVTIHAHNGRPHRKNWDRIQASFAILLPSAAPTLKIALPGAARPGQWWWFNGSMMVKWWFNGSLCFFLILSPSGNLT